MNRTKTKKTQRGPRMAIKGVTTLTAGGPPRVLTHLVRLPVPEEVDGAVPPPLDDGPASGVVPLVAPHLHEAVSVLRLHQVHAAGRVAVLQRLQSVLPRPCYRTANTHTHRFGITCHQCGCFTFTFESFSRRSHLDRVTVSTLTFLPLRPVG